MLEKLINIPSAGQEIPHFLLHLKFIAVKIAVFWDIAPSVSYKLNDVSGVPTASTIRVMSNPHAGKRLVEKEQTEPGRKHRTASTEQ
jgi:hypothetical protein